MGRDERRPRLVRPQPAPPIIIPREAFLALQVAILQQQAWQTQGMRLQEQVQRAMVAAGLDPSRRYALNAETGAATLQD